MKLSERALNRPITTYMFFLIAILLGIISLIRLPVDLMPEIEYPTITVRTNYPGVAPGEIESLVTRPIERSLSSAPGVRELISSSAEGFSQVRVYFEWGTDLDEAANEVRSRLDRIRRLLPEDIEPPSIFKFDISQFPILWMSMSADMDPRELRRLAENEIQYRLERVPGVAAVDIMGGLRREIQVNLSLEKLRALDLSVNEIVQAIRAETLNLPVGPIYEGSYELLLRTQGEFQSVAEMRQMIVAVRRGIPVYLKDIARIEDSFEEVRSLVRVDGRPAIRLAVRKQSGANTVQVADQVHAEVERIHRDIAGVRIWPIMDSSIFIKRAISNVRQSAIYGSILAVIILFIFLRNFRSTLIISLAIPISVIATFALMYFYGFTLNTMSFGGLALGVGMLLDNAIVVLENIFRHREAGRSRREAALIGSQEVGTAITASTLTTIAVFIPLVFLTGMSGIMFKQLSYVVAFSLFCSLLVALTLIPVLCSKYLIVVPPDQQQRSLGARLRLWSGRALEALDLRYRNALARVLDNSVIVIAAALLLLAGSIYLTRFIGFELLPETDEGEVRVTLELPTGTRLEVTDSYAQRIEEIIRQNVPEVEHILAEIGGGGGWEAPQTHIAQIRIKLVDLDKRRRSSQQIAAALRPALSGMPGALARVRPGGGLMFMRLGQTSGDRIAVEVRGHDLEVGRELAEKVKNMVEQVPGVTDAQISRKDGMPELLIRPDRAKASLAGISVSQLANTLRTTVGGTRAAYFRDGEDEYNILVRLESQDRARLDQIKQIPLYTPLGKILPVENLVEMARSEGPISIERKNQERIITVSADLAGRDLGSVMLDIAGRLEGVPRPDDFFISFGGEFEEQQRAFAELLLSLILALILVYMVMAAQFESLRDPFIIFFAVPMAAIGVTLALFLTSTTFSMQAFIGAIMLGGIVVNNGIVLVDYINLLRRSYGYQLREAIVEAGRRRLRPILMTTLTTMLALVPMSLGLGEGGEVQAPMARVIIGGLATSTFVTLFLVPVIYHLFERKHAQRKDTAGTA